MHWRAGWQVVPDGPASPSKAIWTLLRVDPVEDGYEAVFRVGTLVDSSLTARLAPVPPAGVRLTGVSGATRHPRHPADLSGHECLGYASTRGESGDWRFLRDAAKSMPASIVSRR